MKLEKFAQWAEIVASVAVILSLVFLIREVQDNTRAIERQADLDRAAALTAPFFEAPELAAVLDKIKGVDGADALPAALVERYGLTSAEAILWERHLWALWLGFQADFERSGPTGELASWVYSAMQTPDNQLYWELMKPAHTGFVAFVEGVMAGE